MTLTIAIPPTSAEEAELAKRQSLEGKAEVAALRPKTHWLAGQINKILAENHLSERIRHSLEG